MKTSNLIRNLTGAAASRLHGGETQPLFSHHTNSPFAAHGVSPPRQWRPRIAAPVLPAAILGCCALTARADIGSPVLTFDAPPYFTTVAFMPGGQQVLLGDGAGSEIVFWDLQTGQQNRAFEGGTWPVAVSLDGSWGLTTSATNAGKLWNLQTMELIRTFVGDTNAITAIAFPPNGQCVLTGQQPDETHLGGEPRLWDASAGQVLRTFVGAEYWGTDAISFSPDGALVAIEIWDGVVDIWDLRDRAAGLRTSRLGGKLELRWELGALQPAETVNGPWQDVMNAVSPFQAELVAGTRSCRVRVEE